MSSKPNWTAGEWDELQKHLTPEQQQDGRRCFYCGVLAMLGRPEVIAVMDIDDLCDLQREIREALKIESKV